MARYSIKGPAIVLAGAFMLGCGSAWTVVVQASPDPFAGQVRFGVLPVDYSSVRVGDKSEVGYLAGKDETERASYAEGKSGLEETFRRTLRSMAERRGVSVVAADSPGEAPFLIRPSVAFLQPGSGASRVELDVKIVAADGDVLDEIQVSHSSETQVGGRLRADGEALGALVANYLQSRIGKVDRAAPVESPPESPEPTPAPKPAAPPPAPLPPAPPPPAVVPVPVPAPVRVEPPPPRPPPPPIAVKTRPAPRPAKRPVIAPKGKRPSAPLAPPQGTPIASAPGFSRLEDGKSRIWVEVSDKVSVVETRTPGRLTYRLLGAAVWQPTDQLALDTAFFTTPVQRVQLVPQGSGVDLIVDLREDLVPAYRMVDTPRGVVLQIDLPRAANFGQSPSADEPSLPPARRGQTSQTLGNPAPPNPDRQQQGGRRGRGRQAPPSPDN